MPHITDHIIERINEASLVPVADVNGVLGAPDIVIIELGENHQRENVANVIFTAPFDKAVQ